jgi:hypothetical protein
MVKPYEKPDVNASSGGSVGGTVLRTAEGQRREDGEPDGPADLLGRVEHT